MQVAATKVGQCMEGVAIEVTTLGAAIGKVVVPGMAKLVGRAGGAQRKIKFVVALQLPQSVIQSVCSRKRYLSRVAQT